MSRRSGRMGFFRRVLHAIREELFVVRYSGDANIHAWPEREPEQAVHVHRLWGLKTGWVSDTRLKWRKCRHCTGGKQILIHREDEHGVLEPFPRWGKIPIGMRREDPDESGPVAANVRDCNHCHGIGHRWTPMRPDELAEEQRRTV